MPQTTVLICDDNESVHQSLKLYLQADGMQAVSVYDGRAALDELGRQSVDLIILDIMLPNLFGTEVCREIRKTSDVPIIFLSAKGDETDRIVGLELGADDYITKPFSPREVVARVKTVLRRAHPKTAGTILQLGKLSINARAYDVRIANEPVKLTPREVELISFLVQNAGAVVSRESILDAVWGCDYYGDVRAVDTLLARLRSKIPEHKARVTFRTIYGVGYIIEEKHD